MGEKVKVKKGLRGDSVKEDSVVENQEVRREVKKERKEKKVNPKNGSQ